MTGRVKLLDLFFFPEIASAIVADLPIRDVVSLMACGPAFQALSTSTLRRPLCVLDLDETLLHSRAETLSTLYEEDSVYVHVTPRPFLDIFLRVVFSCFEVCIFTASTYDYAVNVCQRLLTLGQLEQLRGLFCRDCCIEHLNSYTGEAFYTKPIALVAEACGYGGMTRVFAVDDRPVVYGRWSTHVVRAPPFTAESADDSFLLHLAAVLQDQRFGSPP